MASAGVHEDSSTLHCIVGLPILSTLRFESMLGQTGSETHTGMQRAAPDASGFYTGSSDPRVICHVLYGGMELGGCLKMMALKTRRLPSSNKQKAIGAASTNAGRSESCSCGSLLRLASRYLFFLVSRSNAPTSYFHKMPERGSY